MRFAIVLLLASCLLPVSTGWAQERVLASARHQGIISGPSTLDGPVQLSFVVAPPGVCCVRIPRLFERFALSPANVGQLLIIDSSDPAFSLTAQSLTNNASDYVSISATAGGSTSTLGTERGALHLSTVDLAGFVITRFGLQLTTLRIRRTAAGAVEIDFDFTIYIAGEPVSTCLSPPTSVSTDTTSAAPLAGVTVERERLIGGRRVVDVRLINNLSIWLGVERISVPDGGTVTATDNAGLEEVWAQEQLIPACKTGFLDNPLGNPSLCREPGGAKWTVLFCTRGTKAGYLLAITWKAGLATIIC
jgi:hypothetical protein